MRKDRMFSFHENMRSYFLIGDYQVNTLINMFQHYNEYGFIGNYNALTWILGRKPNDFSPFIHRTSKSKRL
jgi:hypothetical protein